MTTGLRTVTITLLALATSAPALAMTPQDPAVAKNRLAGPWTDQPAVVAKHRLAGPWTDQQSAPQTKPDAKPAADPKAVTAATLAGKWNVNIDNPSGAMQVFLELKNDPKDAKKVTGTISSQMGDANLEGEVVDGKLSFHFTMNANGSDIAVSFAGTQQKDGSLAGTLEYGQGPVNWTGTREKKN